MANKVVTVCRAMEKLDEGIFDALNHFSYGTHINKEAVIFL